MLLTPDPLNGGLWIGFWEGGLAYFKDGQVRASYARSQMGWARAPSPTCEFDRDGALWAATEGGLSRVKNGACCDANQQEWITMR